MILAVVCVLSLGGVFTPPANWTIDKITYVPEVWYMEYTTKPHVKIDLHREITLGDRVAMPQDCQGEATVRAEVKKSFDTTPR